MDTLVEEAGCIIQNYAKEGDVLDEDSGSDDVSADLATDNIFEMMEDLRTDVDCLFNLLPALRSPPKDLGSSEITRQVTLKTPTAPNHHFVDVIRNQFPSAKAFIVEKLGQYNFERYLRLQRERMTNEQQVAFETLHIEPRTQVATKFRDSGIGSSVPSGSLPVAVLCPPKGPPSMTSGVIRGNCSKYPHISELSSSGEPFECVACGKKVQIGSNRLWREHLLQDLKPYVCAFPTCGYIGDALKWSDWATHYEQVHWNPSNRREKCPLCRESIDITSESGVANFLKHISGHLEDIAFTALPKECDSYPEESEDKGEQSKSISMTDKEPATSMNGMSPNAEVIEIIRKSLDQGLRAIL